MSKVVDEVVGANQMYAQEFGAKRELALPPARQFTILTCMDARLDPAKYAGLADLFRLRPSAPRRPRHYKPAANQT
jgi:carbonic anhydrase